MLNWIKLHRIRRVVQLISLFAIGEFSFYGIFRCPFAVPYVSCANCPVVQCPGRKLWLPVWLAILGSAILFGRAFCGWACPGGLISEILSKFSLLRKKIKVRLELFLNTGKYVLLAISIYFIFITINPRWAIPIRTGEFFKSVGLTFEYANTLWLTRTIIILAALIFAVLIPNFWCRYLCPTGGCLEIFRKLTIFKYFKTSDCNDCNACRKVCNMETRPTEINCTNCGDCVHSCPVNAIQLGTGKKS